ncbi:16248_t:CDS:2, partial [Acaulospora colombiana]
LDSLDRSSVDGFVRGRCPVEGSSKEMMAPIISSMSRHLLVFKVAIISRKHDKISSSTTSDLSESYLMLLGYGNLVDTTCHYWALLVQGPIS